jgi:anti-sigma factor RsiW
MGSLLSTIRELLEQDAKKASAPAETAPIQEDRAAPPAGPLPPIPPGWLITYSGPAGLLRGGSDGQGTVKSAVYSEEGWRFTVENGDVVALAAIKGVGQTDSSGKLVAAWLVNRFGYDGKKNDP